MSFLGLFGGVKSALKTAETGAKVVEIAANGISAGIDMAFYTPEEKALADQKILDTKLGFWQTFATENSEQSKARRELAKMFTLMFAGVLGVGVGLVLIGDMTRLDNLIKLLGALGFAWIIGCVVGTYFVPHQFSKLGVLQGKK